MAEEKKVTQATAKSVGDWVGAFYGDDAVDMSKANKIRHLIKTGQFASVVYVISKNSKLAHTDLSESNYSVVDTMYAKAAELIIRLLHRKYRDGGRPLTSTDFDECGGRDLFGGRPNYDQICSDYISAGGMVDTAQTALPVYESDEANAKCYGGIVDDIKDVKQDHTYLLAVTGAKDGVLDREQIFNLYDTTTDVSTKIWKKLKDAKSGGEFKLQEQFEEAFYLKYDLAKKSAKVGLVGAGAAYAVGAMAGGLIFVPAIVALGAYALGKKWIPDWFKSAGSMWGSIEKRYKTKRSIKAAIARMDWLVRYVESGGKPNKNRSLKQIFNDMRFMTKVDQAVYKKQAKTLGFSSIELSDGKTHKGILHEAKEGAARLGNLMSGRDKNSMVPADIMHQLQRRISAINESETNIYEFNDLAFDMKVDIESLGSADKRKILALYADKLMKSAQTLVFKANFETGTDYQDKISKFLSEESSILSIIKDFDPNTVEKVKRFVTFASKELTGLNEEYIGGPLENYINRIPTPKMDVDGTGLILTEEVVTDGVASTVVRFDLSAYAGISPHVATAINMISNLALNPSDDREFIVAGTNQKLADITREIAQIKVPDTATDAEKRAAAEARDICSSALNRQMNMVVYAKSRADSRETYKAVMEGNYAGKLQFADTFKKFGEVTYENVETFASFYYDMGKTEPKEVREYIRGKFGKQVYDIMKGYAGSNVAVFKKDLSAYAEYLKKVNNSQFLNEQQKMDLSSTASSIIQTAFIEDVKNLPDIFMAQYSQDKYIKLLKSYASGGFEELFESNQSSEVQGVKAGIEYMRDLASIHKTLKFGGSYNMSQEESQYIAKTYLLNRESSGEYPMVRNSDDKLKVFIEKHLKEIKPTFGEGLNPTYLTANSTYAQLLGAYEYIVGNGSTIVAMPETTLNEKHDKYTALLILKNKCVAMFRTYMSEYIGEQYSSSGDPDQKSRWLERNMGLVGSVKTAWTDIMTRIDESLETFRGLKEVQLTSTASDELGKYKTGQMALNTASAQELG